MDVHHWFVDLIFHLWTISCIQSKGLFVIDLMRLNTVELWFMEWIGWSYEWRTHNNKGNINERIKLCIKKLEKTIFILRLCYQLDDDTLYCSYIIKCNKLFVFLAILWCIVDTSIIQKNTFAISIFEKHCSITNTYSVIYRTIYLEGVGEGVDLFIQRRHTHKLTPTPRQKWK